MTREPVPLAISFAVADGGCIIFMFTGVCILLGKPPSGLLHTVAVKSAVAATFDATFFQESNPGSFFLAASVSAQGRGLEEEEPSVADRC